MPLNLGHLSSGQHTNMSFDDAYIAWLEADQKFINLTNAMEIVEKAKASGSNEVMLFAEDLLGCSLSEFEASMEVQLRPQTAGGNEPSARYKAKWAHVIEDNEAPEVNALLDALNTAYDRLSRLDDRLTSHDANQPVHIPTYIFKLCQKSPYFKKQLPSGKNSIKCAVIAYLGAIDTVMRIFNGMDKQLRYQRKSSYMTARNSAARLLKDVRSFIQKTNKNIDARINS